MSIKGLNAALDGLRVFQLKNYTIPKVFLRMRTLRVFAYIQEEKPNGEIIALYETSYDGDPIKHSVYTRFDTETGVEEQITREDFLEHKFNELNPVIFNLYMHMSHGRIFWVMAHQDNGDAYGFTYGKLWPWLHMMPKEIHDFPTRCKNYVKRENVDKTL